MHSWSKILLQSPGSWTVFDDTVRTSSFTNTTPPVYGRSPDETLTKGCVLTKKVCVRICWRDMLSSSEIVVPKVHTGLDEEEPKGSKARTEKLPEAFAGGGGEEGQSESNSALA
jgi:hypothetical protein